MFTLIFIGIIYYLLAAIAGIILLSDLEDNYIWKSKSALFKFWYFLFFVLAFSQIAYTPYRFILLVVSLKSRMNFLEQVKFHMKGISR